jgi:hypothetical protein
MKSKYPIGTIKAQKPKAWRLRAYLRGLGWFLALAAFAVGVLAVAQILFHPFDMVLETAEKSLAMADQTLTSDAVAGVSIGSLVLVAIVATLPLLKKGVRRRQYGLSFWRGILSSAIFLATDKLYRYVQGLGFLYFSATLALFIAATIVLVEIVSRLSNIQEESDTRTELLASIVSGLAFGIIVQMAEYFLKSLPGLLGRT